MDIRATEKWWNYDLWKIELCNYFCGMRRAEVDKEREGECVCVCVCERERERERENTILIFLYYRLRLTSAKRS